MRLMVTAFFFLLFSSCGFKGLRKIIVPRLSYIVADKTGEQLDLYYSQEKKFKKELEVLFQSEMDQVIKLRSIIAGIDLEKSKPEVFLEDVLLTARKTLQQFNIILAKYTANLSKDQQKSFFKIQKEKNEEIVERIQNEDLDKIFERYEFFFGDLNKKQKKLIESEKKEFVGLISKRLKRRTSSQEKLREWFKTQTKEQREVSILALYNSNIVEGQDQARLGKSLAIFKRIITSLTKEQKSHFKETQEIIIAWIDEFIKVYSKKDS